MDTIKKILHPGVNKDGKQEYHEGIGDTTNHTTFEATETRLPDDDRSGIGMGYGTAQGVDTRANQFEHDMKQELGDAEDRRTGIGMGYEAPAGGIGEGDNTMDSKFQKDLSKGMQEELGVSTEQRAGVGQGYQAPSGGIGEGHNTIDSKFEKNIQKDLSTSGFEETPSTTATTSGFASQPGASSSATYADEITPAPALGTTQHVSQHQQPQQSHQQPDQSAKLIPGRRESVVDSVLSAGHSDPSRAGQTGTHSSYVANILDPNSGPNAK